MHSRDISDILHKTDRLGEAVCGLFGSNWLIFARTPTDEMLDRTWHVRLLGPEDLPRLRDHVQAWMAD